MSSKAPISGDDKVSEAFKAAKSDSGFGFLQLGIDMDSNKFVLLENAETLGDDDKNWDKILSLLPEKDHCYFVVRDPTKEGLFILLHWGPDLSPVRQRMLYASSRATLKSFLGAANFTPDYYMNIQSDVNVDKMVKQRTLHHDIDFRSDAEIAQEETNLESAPKSTQATVMQPLPIEMKQSGKDAIAKFIAKDLELIFLKLNEQDQSIEGEEQKESGVNAVRALLPDEEPRYLLFTHTNPENKETKPVFGYYCPDKAQRKLKFTYSTCKVNLIDYCAANELQFAGKVEFTDKKDFTEDFLTYHVFPKKYEKAEFAKPKAPGGNKKNPRSKRRKKLDV